MSYAMIPPLARELELEYLRFGASGAETRMPCRRRRDPGIGGPKVENQCAVRMSVALSRAKGQDILTFYEGDAVHHAACCAGPDPYPHISSARSLFHHIRSSMNFPFTRITGGVEAVRGRKGIIFFDGVFTRKNGTRGDHIDYWNGTTYMNEATGTGAPRGGLPMFSNAEEIWFCEL